MMRQRRIRIRDGRNLYQLNMRNVQISLLIAAAIIGVSGVWLTDYVLYRREVRHEKDITNINYVVSKASEFKAVMPNRGQGEIP